MRHPVSLLVEFQGLDSHYIQRVSNDEYSGSCPKCGGVPHQSGELPDRFRMWIRSKTTGGALGWCRQCGYVWLPKGETISADRREAWIKEREAIEYERRSRAERAIDLLQRERAWIKYHEQLTGEVRHMFYKRGITDYFIEEWKLGYNPDKIVWDGEREFHSATLTIPVFDPRSHSVVTIRNRLLNPVNEKDKYRPEYGGLPSSLYHTIIDKIPVNKAFVVEGEFKAMTTFIALDDPDMHVVGIPGKSPSLEMFSVLDQCEIVYICLDPDADQSNNRSGVSPLQRIAGHFGRRARLISLPYKIDDMISGGIIGKNEIKGLLNGARRVI